MLALSVLDCHIASRGGETVMRLESEQNRCHASHHIGRVLVLHQNKLSDARGPIVQGCERNHSFFWCVLFVVTNGPRN